MTFDTTTHITPRAPGDLMGQAPQNSNSLAAFLQVAHRREHYQRIIAVLSDGNSRTREQLEVATGISGNALRPRVIELREAGIVTTAGTGTTRSGRRAEKLTLTTLTYPSM